MLKKIKSDLITLIKEVTELKKSKKTGDKFNHSYWSLQYDKKHWWRRVPIPIWNDGQKILVSSSASITDEMIKEQDENHKKYSLCVNELELKRFILRHLFIVYGHMRGKTRDQIEPKFSLKPGHNYNPVTKKYLTGDDPIDWSYIWELKKEYLPQAEERS
jgi:hypothetical protein